MTDARIENNRELWDAWTRLHVDTESEYQPRIDCLKAGGVPLDEIDHAEVGEVSGMTMLHLQCHFGIESLAWTRLGAQVTGVDLSPEAIRQARALSAETGLEAAFICSDVYELPSALDRTFDVVYNSGGILVWLPDLFRWAKIVSGFLKPGGVFYLRDGHPTRRVVFPLRRGGDGEIGTYRYFSSEPVRIVERGSYAQENSEQCHAAFYWVHGLGEVVSALCAAGLRIEYLHEFPRVYEDYPVVMHHPPDAGEVVVLHNWEIPHTFSIRARKEP